MQEVELQPRKSPQQERSAALMEALVEATARVLADDGYRGATTKRIAAVAGVSVGSLYQYFPGKDALVFAVQQRHFDQVMQALARVSLAPDQPLGAAVQGFVRGMVAGHDLDASLHRALTEQMLRLGPAPFREAQDRAVGMVRGILGLRADEVAVADLDTAAWLLVTTVEGAVHAALMGGDGRLADPRFERELTALVCRYLGVAPITGS